MKTDKNEGVSVFGAQVLLKHLGALEKEQEGVRSGHADIEYIHRMRVASRRLRAALPLFEACLPKKKAAVWLKDIRQITSALGAARDVDVQIDTLTNYQQKQQDTTHHAGINRLLLRLNQKRQSLQPKLEAAMEKLAQDGTVAELRSVLEPQAERSTDIYQFTPQLYRHAFQHISGRLEEFLGYAEIVHLPEKVAELHEMRIAAKWLRYTMENFSSMYGGELKTWLSPVREMQEQLGEIHDCDVWGGFLPRFMEKERERTMAYLGHIKSYKRLTVGLEGFLADRLALRERRYQDFVAFWDAQLAEELWEGLRKQIGMPVTAAPNWPPVNK